MKKRLSTAVPILFVLCFFIYAQFVAALSVGVAVDVSKGDTFTYSSSYLWSSTNTSESVPADALEANQTSQIQIVLTSVSGSLINATKTYHYQNGTTQTTDGYADVASGDNEEVGAFFFASSNLSVGDRVYPSGLYGDIINQTLQQEYAGSQREVLLDSSTYRFEYNTTVAGNPAARILNSQIDYFFDRQTGVCVEQREQTTITDPATAQSETTTSLIQLTQTNLWGGSTSEFPTLTVVAVSGVVIASVVAAVLFFVRRK